MALVQLINVFELLFGIGIDNVGFAMDASLVIDFIAVVVRECLLADFQDVEHHVPLDLGDVLDILDEVLVCFHIVVGVLIGDLESIEALIPQDIEIAEQFVFAGPLSSLFFAARSLWHFVVFKNLFCESVSYIASHL